MGCPVLTQERIDLLLKGELPSADRPLLLAHLSDPCDECLETLASPANEGLVARVIGEDLTAEESERIFAAAATSAPAARATGKRRLPHWARRAWAAAAATGAAAAAAALFHVSPWSASRQKPDVPVASWRPKSAVPMKESLDSARALLDLIMIAGEPGRPQSLHVVPSDGGRIRPGEVLLFRVRNGGAPPGHVALVALREGRAPLALWLDAPLESRDPGRGEFEVASGGHALSFDIRRLGLAGPSIRLAAIALHGPLSADELSRLPSNPDQLSRALPQASIIFARVTLEEGDRP